MLAKIELPPAKSHPLAHVDEYLAIGQAGDASDVHLGVNSRPIWRLHGTLQPIWPDAPRLTAEDTAALLDGFIPEFTRRELAELAYTDFAYGKSVARYRTSTVRPVRGTHALFPVI